MEGTVKWFNKNKGFGFIAGEDGKEYFVHFTAIPKGVFIRENDLVSFEPTQTDKGMQAQKITLIQKGSERSQSKEEGSEEQVDEEDQIDEEDEQNFDE